MRAEPAKLLHKVTIAKGVPKPNSLKNNMMGIGRKVGDEI